MLLVVGSTAVFLGLAARPRPTARPLPSPATASPSPSPFVPTPGPTASVCVDLTTWTLDRRLEQLLLVSGVFADLGASAAPARAGVGGFVLFGQPAAGAAPVISAELLALRDDASANGQVVPWISTDEEGGRVQRLAGVIGALPSPRDMGASWTPDHIRSAMAAHATAMRALGVDVDLAPVLDVAPRGDLVADEADRAFSDDPQVVAADGLAYAAGLRAGGVAAVVKHFPGLGHADVNTDLGPSTGPPLSSLQAVDLRPFESAIGAGVPAVMVSHVRVPGLSGALPASLAPATYELLRDSLGFTGVAMTDALDAKAISAAGYSQPAAAVAAIRAGADLAMIDAAQWQPSLAALRAAVRGGLLSDTAIDAGVARVLAAKGLGVCS